MNDLVCVADLGTSTVKAAFVAPDGSLVAFRGCDAPPPVTDGVNFDADALFAVLCNLIRSLAAEHPDSVKKIRGLALSTQRCTVLSVGADGKALSPAYSWQDVSGQNDLEERVRGIGGDVFRTITGLPVTGLCSIAKVLKFRRQNPQAYGRTARFVMLPDYILHRLGAAGFFTDPSNASTFGLLDTRQSRWSGQLMDCVGLSASQLSEVIPTGQMCGRLSQDAAQATGLMAGLPLFAGGGDLPCAAAISGAITPGHASLSLGTAGIVTCPVAAAPETVPQGLFYTVHIAEKMWLLEGQHNAFAGSINWICDLLGLSSVNELFELAWKASAPKPDSPLFLPFLAGIGSPDFDAETAGAFVGLRYAHGRADVARACLEGVCLEMRRILDAMEKVSQVRRINVSGGLSANQGFLQMLVNIAGCPMAHTDTSEASLQGAAAIAWKGAGLYSSVAEAATGLAGKSTRILFPDGSAGEPSHRNRRYREAVSLARRFAGSKTGPV